MSKLTWNFVTGGEWQAGGLTRHFTLNRLDGDKYCLKVRTGDNPEIHVGIFGSMRGAKMRAQTIVDTGIGK